MLPAGDGQQLLPTAQDQVAEPVLPEKGAFPLFHGKEGIAVLLPDQRPELFSQGTWKFLISFLRIRIQIDLPASTAGVRTGTCQTFKALKTGQSYILHGITSSFSKLFNNFPIYRVIIHRIKVTN
jgi:hypothetical protein